MRPLSAALIIGFLLGGCSAAPRVAVKPEVTITDRQAHAQAGHATITLVNPNDHAIEVVEYHYTATALGESPWPGRHAGGLVLASGFEREVTLPVVLPPHVEHGTRVSISGQVRYLDTSTIAQTLSEWGYRPSVGFSGQTTIHNRSTSSADQDG